MNETCLLILTLFVGAGQSNMANQRLQDTFPNSINIAKNGTSLAEWEIGTPLYDKLIQSCKDNRRVVLLWWQGEADAQGLNGYKQWGKRFKQLVWDLRKDAGQDIPVIYVQIGHQTIEKSTWKNISRQQAKLDGHNRMYMVSIKDLYPGPDGLHYTESSYKIIQKRMLKVYQEKIALDK